VKSTVTEHFGKGRVLEISLLYVLVLSIRDKEYCLEANQFKDTVQPLIQSNFSNYNF
jgi:hypothetical protein